MNWLTFHDPIPVCKFIKPEHNRPILCHVAAQIAHVFDQQGRLALHAAQQVAFHQAPPQSLTPYFENYRYFRRYAEPAYHDYLRIDQDDLSNYAKGLLTRLLAATIALDYHTALNEPNKNENCYRQNKVP